MNVLGVDGNVHQKSLQQAIDEVGGGADTHAQHGNGGVSHALSSPPDRDTAITWCS